MWRRCNTLDQVAQSQVGNLTGSGCKKRSEGSDHNKTGNTRNKTETTKQDGMWKYLGLSLDLDLKPVCPFIFHIPSTCWMFTCAACTVSSKHSMGEFGFTILSFSWNVVLQFSSQCRIALAISAFLFALVVSHWFKDGKIWLEKVH